MPPVCLIGFSSGRMTSWPGCSCASAACWPIVLPVTVGASSCSRPSSTEPLREHGGAARGVQVGGDEAPARLEVAQARAGLGDPVEVVDVERDARLARHREQVQDGVGGAAGRRDGQDRVLQARRA